MRNYLKPVIKVIRVSDEHYILAASPSLHDETGNKTQLSKPEFIEEAPGFNFDDGAMADEQKSNMSIWDD